MGWRCWPSRLQFGFAALNAVGRFEDALADADMCLRLGMETANPHIRRGTALAGLGRTDEAFDAFAKAERLEPDNADLYAVRAAVYESIGQPDKAASDRHRVERFRR